MFPLMFQVMKSTTTPVGKPHLHLHPQAEIGWEVSQIPAEGVEEVGPGLKFDSSKFGYISWLVGIFVATSPLPILLDSKKIAGNGSILRLHPGLVYQALEARLRGNCRSQLPRRVIVASKLAKIRVLCVYILAKVDLKPQILKVDVVWYCVYTLIVG